MRRGWLLGTSVLVLACTPRTGGEPDPRPEPVSHAPSRAEPGERAGVSETGAGETPGSLGSAPVDGFFMAEGAPPPRACALASDCLGDTIPDLDQPCCQNPRSLRPYSRDYKRWLGEWRATSCGGVRCPPPPAPTMPPDCAFEVDCVEGVCVDSCP